MMAVAPIQISRSAVVTRKLCPMKRWWSYHALHPEVPVETQVGGLTPVQPPAVTAILRGQWIHRAMQQAISLTMGQSDPWSLSDQIQTDIPTLSPIIQNDWDTLIRRLVWSWMLVRGHNLLTRFQPISAEQEWIWSLHPLVAQSMRMDQIWRERRTGQLLILDFKTLSRPDANWTQRIMMSDQTHSYVQALTERTQEHLLGIQYEGLLIGTMDIDLGCQKSPYLTAYQRGESLIPTYSSGSRVVRTDWDDATWQAWIPRSVLDSLFCTTDIIHPSSNQLLQTKAATVTAEIHWASLVAEVEAAPEKREALIERNADACLKFGWGHACPYLQLCWYNSIPDCDTFMPRVDHHVNDKTTYVTDGSD